MNLPLVALRPEPGLRRTIAAAEALGLQAVAAPLFEIASLDWDAPSPAAFDAIIAGSANAFRHGGTALCNLAALPVHAVGERTARAARAAGFAVASVGEGSLQALVHSLRAPLRLLRLAGEEHLPLAAPAGITIARRIVYRAVPRPLSGRAVEVLRGGAVALLHSAAAAERFARECDRLSLERSHIALAAFGPRIAAAAGRGWHSVAAAERPTDARLLALAAAMCQSSARQERQNGS